MDGDDTSQGQGRPGLVMRVLARWRGLNEWLRALIIAFAILVFTHTFLLGWVTVRSTSMYATLHPGDLTAVTKWPAWAGWDRGDIVVFHDPMQDDRKLGERQLMVKRVVGLPGDVVELRDGELLVNNVPVPPWPGETRSWLVRLRKGTDAHALLNELHLPVSGSPSDTRELELPLNERLALTLRGWDDVLGVERMRNARGYAAHLFPFSPYHRWNTDDYGPIIIPRQGDRVKVDTRSLPLYDRIITHYEGNDAEAVRAAIPAENGDQVTYTMRQDYYFVLGDSRHHSDDSRHWGFLPADHLVGRAWFVLLGHDLNQGGIRDDRWFTGVR